MPTFQILPFPGPEMAGFSKKCKRKFIIFEKNSNFYPFSFDRIFVSLLLDKKGSFEKKTCQIVVVNFFKFQILENV